MAIEPIPLRRDHVDRHPPRQVASDIDHLLSSFGAPPAPVLSVVVERWTDIVGPVVADHASPGSLVGGCLRIEAESSIWASQLRWSRTDMVSRCAEVLGHGAVTSIEVRVSKTSG